MLQPPQDNLLQAMDEALTTLKEREIVAVSSKVVAIHQGRCVLKQAADKDELVRRESDAYLEKKTGAPGLTLKHHTIVGAAGIDESNGDGFYVLWPERINETAELLWKHLANRFSLQELGVIIVDSHSVPLRLGAVGVTLGLFGFEPVISHAGQPDLFGRPFRFSTTNLADSLAAAAVLAMGETNEQTPLAIVRGAPVRRFTTQPTSDALWVSPHEDKYRPLLQPIIDQLSARANEEA